MRLIYPSFIIFTALLIGPIAAEAQGDMSVAINVTLSDRATARLASDKESIIAFASYSAEPKKNAVATATKADAIGPDGMVDLTPTQESVEISGKGGAARITGKNIDAKRLSWITGPLHVNVNVASARKSSADNILDCDFIDGPLKKVQEAPITLRCGLIEGDHIETKLKP